MSIKYLSTDVEWAADYMLWVWDLGRPFTITCQVLKEFSICSLRNLRRLLSVSFSQEFLPEMGTEFGKMFFMHQLTQSCFSSLTC